MISLYDYCTKYHLDDHYNRNVLKRIRRLNKRSHKIENFMDYLEYEITAPEWKNRHICGGMMIGFICKFKDPTAHYTVNKIRDYQFDYIFEPKRINNLKETSR